MALIEEDAALDEGAGEPTSKTPEEARPPARRPGKTGGGGGRRGPLTLLLLLLLVWAGSSRHVLPDAVPLAAPDTTFSSGRAMLDLVRIARSAHPPGSPHHDRVREMLLDRLVGLGLTPQVQTTTSVRATRSRATVATVRNVLARVPGTGSTGAILLTAHYDGRGISRAAGDDGAGVVAILETLRAVRAGPPLRNDVIVLFTDGEELGLLGAEAFVREHPWLEDVAVVLSVEMRGGGGPSIMFETGSENGWIVRALAAGDPRPFANSMSVEIYRRLPNDTDFSPFRDRGVQGLNFAGIDRAHVYHQAWDEPARLDERTLQHHGLHLLGMTRELGGRDLSDVDAPDRIYFRLPLLGLVTYPPAVGYGLALAILLGVVAVFVLIRRAGAPAGAPDRQPGGPAGGIVAGVVLAALAGAAAAGGGHLLFEELRVLHPELGALHGSAFHVESWYVAGLAVFSVTVTVLLLGLARRRFALGALTLGAVLPAALAALFLTFAAPLVAMNLHWPVLLALAGAALVAGVGPGRRPGIPAWLLLLALGAGVSAFAVHLTEFVWLALSFRAAALLGGLVVLWSVLLLPLLDVLREPGGWRAPLAGFVAAAGLIGVGTLHARPSAERPAPSTLLYVLDRDAGSASWAGRDGSGLAWASSRVGPLEESRAFDDPFLRPGSYRTGPAPVVDAPAPDVSAGVAPVPPGMDPATTRRSLALSVRSLAGAEMVGFRLPSSGDVFLEAVNGRPMPDPVPEEGSDSGRLRSVAHWGTPVGPPPGDGEALGVGGSVVLQLDVGPGVDTVAVELFEHHLRPGELLGEEPFLRPPDLAPDIVSGSDRAVLRSTVRIVVRTGEVLAGAGVAPDSP